MQFGKIYKYDSCAYGNKRRVYVFKFKLKNKIIKCEFTHQNVEKDIKEDTPESVKQYMLEKCFIFANVSNYNDEDFEVEEVKNKDEITQLKSKLIMKLSEIANNLYFFSVKEIIYISEILKFKCFGEDFGEDND